MLFNSYEFVIFYLVILFLYFNTNRSGKLFVLLLGSYYFYMSWKWEFGLLMFAVSLFNWYMGRHIFISSGWRRKALLWTAIAVSLLPLFYYKYLNFFIDSANTLSGYFFSPLDWPFVAVILPVGISFFTFQAMSYSIDIYRNKIPVEENALHFLTYVAFFPQLIAGPIERSTNILPQLKKEVHFDWILFEQGAKLFVWGLFKKIVIADRLSLYADPVFNSPQAYEAPTLALGTLFFTLQIYCDFSGYSDMAIGIGRTLGIRLMQNFNLPYMALSIGDFWKRWHISLSSWFGDYVYIPLGGNRVKVSRWFLNIAIVFLLSGLWHGANWTFVIWGALHASFYFFEYFGDKLLAVLGLTGIKKSGGYRLFKWFSTFSAVMLGWIFFRANSAGDAWYILSQLLSWSGSQLWTGFSAINFYLSLLLIAFLFGVQLLQYYGILGLYDKHSRLPRWLVNTGYFVLLFLISIFGVSSNAFIYFQF
ncbi:MAG: MBOAT family O-acyltransferase [Nitritalea sp.]